MIRLVLVDDESIVRSGIALLLSGEPDFEIIADVGTGQQAVQVAIAQRPDVVIADVRMPGMDGWKPPGGSWTRRARAPMTAGHPCGSSC